MVAKVIDFPPFRLDFANAQLWRETKLVPLRPKTFAVLRYLVEHSDQVVTKEELVAHVWPDTVGSEEAPKRCIHELRTALGDDADTPRYIETRGRRGYRFIAPLIAPSHTSLRSRIQSRELEELKTVSRDPVQDSRLQALDLPLVGRESELSRLHQLLSRAMTGERQLVFVTGEPGIGKTVLVEAFIQSLESGVHSPKSQVHRQDTARRSAGRRERGDLRALSSLAPSSLPLAPLFIARGQCIAHHGAGEPYLPLLEALGRLGRQVPHAPVLTVLRHYAPSWLAQLPALMSEEDREVLPRLLQGATKERMLRELAEALEVLTATTPLVLVLEDLHWCDVATLDWLFAVAQRRDPASLLIIGTYRPVDVIVQQHPLHTVKHELQLRGHCQELALAGFPTDSVTDMLAHRFPMHCFPTFLSHILHDRTEGNPLFLTAVLEEWVTRGVLYQAEGHWHVQDTVDHALATVPMTIAQMIEHQVRRLSPQEQRIFEAASVAGASFVTATIATACNLELREVEACCAELARRALVITEQGVNKWPDGTIASQFQFLHALYRDAVYQRIPLGQRVLLHQRIGECLEQAYGDHSVEIAAELAMHFEEGQDLHRAVQYYQQATANALRRHAYSEVLSLSSRALTLVHADPDPHARAQRTLALHFCRLQAILTTKGHASPEVQAAYEQLLALCEEVGTPTQHFSVLMGFGRLHHGHSEYQRTLALSWQCVDIAHREQSAVLLGAAYYMVGVSELLLGNIVSAHDALAQGMSYYDNSHHVTFTELYGSSPYISCCCYAALSLWLLGYPDRAVAHAKQTRTHAHELAHLYTSASALGLTPLVFIGCRHGAEVQQQAEESLAAAERMEYPFWRAISLFLCGWGIAEQGDWDEGILLMQYGLAEQQRTGSSVHGVHFAILLAEALCRAGQVEEGRRTLAAAEATMERTGERMYAAELYRVKGELTLQKGARRWEVGSSPLSFSSPYPKSQILDPASEAEGYFLQAITIARQQQAKSLELRAVMSLVRLRQQHVREQRARSAPHAIRIALAEAHRMLFEVYNWFTEGCETADLREAKGLLDELSDRANEAVAD